MIKDKIFRDPVHGYITVPSDYCEYIVDTLLFQRLRRIEQTSMRSLYPSACHDRFIHSLGTFHLGRMAFSSIKKNSYKEITNISTRAWNKLQKTFELACLLHDCGHAPFSHIFEKYYNIGGNLREELESVMSNQAFKRDFTVTKSKEHENVGAILVNMDPIKSILKNTFKVDPELVGRMIIGCKYRDSDAPKEKKLANCFIALLNGQAIDVDKLDYICRDKWVSGFSSHNLDIHRLISSMVIKNGTRGRYTLCYYKNAISEIQGVIDVKEFMSLWIYMHHKIVYDTYLLDKAVNRLATILNGGEKAGAMTKLFNKNSILTPQIIHNHTIYLPSDDDIIHLLKCYLPENDVAEEWFSRNHKLKPVWKSYVEFSNLFGSISTSDGSQHALLFKTEEIIEDFLRQNGFSGTDYYKKQFEPDVVQILQNEVSIFLNGEITNYESLKLPKKTDDNVLKFFFYLFIPKELIPKKKELIDSIFDYANS